MSDSFEEHGRDLLRSLKSEPEPTPIDRARLRARIAARVAEGANPESDGAAEPESPPELADPDAVNTVAQGADAVQAAVLGVSKTAAILMTAAGVVVGGVGGALTHEALREPTIIIREVEVPTALPSTEEPPTEREELAPREEEVQLAPSSESQLPTAHESEAPEGPSNRQERALLRQAHAALSRTAPEDALAAIAAHRRAFPRSHFAEERDALEIQALMAANETERASARAERFVERYPSSVFLPRVRAAIRR